MSIRIPHPFPFDPTYGHSPEDLLAVRMDDPAPEDFDPFWRNLREQASTVSLEMAVRELPSPKPEFRLLRVDYTSFPDYRIGAWAILPHDTQAIKFGHVVGHGYGGREAPEWNHAHASRAVIFPVAPGFHISADPRLPLNNAARHVIHGIESPHTYLLGPCAAAFWTAPDILSALLPEISLRYHYVGWSFGGGIGTLMLPWEPRYESAEIGQPTFGNHPFRLRHECAGSGESVRRLWLRRPEIASTLRYFDAVFAARSLNIPAVYACSQFDPSVPPPGQFSVFHAHNGPKRLSRFTSGHFDESVSDLGAETKAHEQNLRELIGEAAVPF
ncbi:MAG: acetylxylan esterase [Terrimicrobiaceae bacterium]